MGKYLILAALWFNLAAISATAKTTVLHSGHCGNGELYLIAQNSGALIRVDRGEDEPDKQNVIIFRAQPRHGWASQRVLRRFDLQLEDDGPRIFNTGGFCERS